MVDMLKASGIRNAKCPCMTLGYHEWRFGGCVVEAVIGRLVLFALFEGL